MLKARTRYNLQKLYTAWQRGTLVEKVSRKLSMSVYVPLRVTRDYLKLPAQDRSLAIDDGFADHRSNPRFVPATDEVVHRVVQAYQRAKADEKDMPVAMQVRGLWREWIEINYGSLMAALRQADTQRLKQLFDNYNREGFAIGTGAGYDDYVRYKVSAMARPYVCAVWSAYRDRLLAKGRTLSRIQHPMIGNPAGVPFDGTILQIDTLRHAYNAATITELLTGAANPTIVEIGGGFGGQAHQLLSSEFHPGRYLLFDIPEVAAVCSFFLLTALPERRVCLYGEGAVSAVAGAEYDVGIFPHFAIAELEERSVDLVFNAHSFAEMNAATCLAYLDVVNHVCRRYFLHINHDTRLVTHEPDGTRSVNMPGSDTIPDEGRFRRVHQRPYPLTRPEDRPFRVVEHLFERVAHR
jgi:putative sugar O-methyltransferase